MPARRTDHPERGSSLIEGMVALLVFAIMTTGSLVGIAQALKMIADTRFRQAAHNLASQELDRVRAIPELKDMLDDQHDLSLDGQNYHITRTVSWKPRAIDPSNPDSGSTVCQHVPVDRTVAVAVDVAVSWDGMSAIGGPVRSTTRISANDDVESPGTGSIVVETFTFDGARSTDAAINAVITATPIPGDPSPSMPPKEVPGNCSTVRDLQPGNYTVVLQSGGSRLTPTQETVPSQTVTVVAGHSVSAQFIYEQRALLQPVNSSTGLLPSNMAVAIIGRDNATSYSYDGAPLPVAASHTGYQLVAGGSETCALADPDEWDGAGRDAPVPVTDTSAATELPVQLAALSLTDLAGVTTITALDPSGSCAPLIFDRTEPARGDETLLLPFGTWRITAGTQVIDATLAPERHS